MKGIKIAYWVSTGLLTLLSLLSAIMYFTNYPEVSKTFESLGYPTYIIYPLAIAKILGLVAIWTKRSKTLKEWAYAGFFFDALLAASAHIMVSDGAQSPAIVAIVLVLVSYWSEQKVYPTGTY